MGCGDEFDMLKLKGPVLAVTVRTDGLHGPRG